MIDETLLMNAISSIGDGVIITDKQGFITFLNPYAEKLTGWSSDAAIDRYMDEVFHLIDFLTKQKIKSPIQKVLDNVCSVGLQNYSALVKRDGGIIFVSANCSPIRNNAGEIEGAVIVFRDIDRIKHMEEDIRREKNNLKNVLMALPQVILMMDKTEVIKWDNSQFNKMFQMDTPNVTGYRFGDISNCLNSYECGCGGGTNCPNCEIRKALRNAIVNKEDEKDIVVRHTVSGNNQVETHWLRINFILIASGGENEILMVIDDISKQKEYEGYLTKCKEEAEAANRAKSEFLANMTHELRTPLNGILGMANLLLTSGLDEIQKENAQMIKICATGLSQIINDLLDAAKIEAGKLEIINFGFDIRDLLDEIINLFTVLAGKKNLSFQYSISPEIPNILKGDPNRLRQIINNLISNAIKFTNSGGIRFDVELLSLTKQAAEIRFSVSDTGIGISDENLDRIFQKFHQLDTSRTREYGGTGMGLAISKQLIEIMNGDIGVTSKKGTGSTFHFTLSFDLDRKKSYDGNNNVNFGELII